MGERFPFLVFLSWPSWRWRWRWKRSRRAWGARGLESGEVEMLVLGAPLLLWALLALTTTH